MHVGLGLDERMRSARNVRVEESSQGWLAGTTHVDHHVTIELASSLGQEAQVQVVDRLPVSDEEGVTVELLASEPKAEPYDQVERGAKVRGGLTWRVALPGGGKAQVTFSYRIRLSAKRELVGGNRRD